MQGKIADIQPFAELARSATTVVYKGYQRSLGRFVLLKVLKPGLSHDDERLRRFEDEARLIAQVQHPNVVAIYASGRDDGQAYIAAEFVEGFDGRHLMAQGPLPPDLAVFIVLEAARGLQAAHAHGILHRDLKPSNILVSHEGQVKLTDFGMASLAEEEAGAEVRGTPGYLAPELVRGEPPTEASDLFSLGVTFYEMLAGRAAFTGANTGVLLDAVLHHDPLPRLERFADLPAALHPICARLLAKNPDERYRDAGTLIADLEAFRAAGGVTTGAAALKSYLDDPDAYRSTLKALVALPTERASEDRPAASPERAGPRRHLPWAWGVVLAVLLVGGLGSSLFFGNGQPAPPSVDLAEEAASRLPEVDTNRLVPPEEEQGDHAVPAEAEPEQQQAVVPPPRDSLETTSLALDDTASAAPAEAVSLDAFRDSDEATGTLYLDVKPWADVYVDEEHRGESPPLLALSLSVGRHRLALKNDQFPEYSAEVEVRANEEDSLRISLWDLVGRLSIQVSPWAVVVIDGVVRDTLSPQEHLLIVAPGKRRLTLRHPELGFYDTTFTIARGEVKTFRFNLNKLLAK